MLFESLVLIGGIAFLILAQLLRGALAIGFARVEARPQAGPLHDPGSQALFEQARQTLQGLGYRAPLTVRLRYEPADAGIIDAQEVWRDPHSGALVWLVAPLTVQRPDTLLVYFTTRLDDGRWAVSQVDESFFAMLADPQTPAQRIQGTDLAVAHARHVQFQQTLGPPHPEATQDHAILEFAAEWQNRMRDRLIARGALRVDADLARPRLRLALVILRAWLKQTSRRAPGTAIPVQRLARLAINMRRLHERAPAATVQWRLTLLSALLSVAVGAIVFDLRMAALVVAVIVLHEAGHWLAMRAFGYRNPHITLLPLLGGVTIGRETMPSAHQRAWVSLAGPLPGLLLAVVMLLVTLAVVGAAPIPTWVLIAIGVLFLINYLNLLPVPPLDGSQLLRALLPTRLLLLQTLVYALGLLLGVWLAWRYELWILALLALLQSMLLPGLLREARLMRHFSGLPAPRSPCRHPRLVWVLEELDRLSRRPETAGRRLARAERILDQLELRPMGTRQRIALGTLYLMLLFAPLPMLLSLLPGGSAASNANSARDRMTLQIQAEVDEALPHLTPKALVDDLQATGEARAEAADPARLQHARERLGLAPGQPWPAALDTVFEISNGIQAVGLAPLEDIRPLSESPAAQALLAIAARGGELLVWLESSEQPYALSVERLQRWWLVGGLGEEQLYLVDPGKEPLIPGHRFIDLFIEAPIAHRDALTWLQGWWRDQSVAERWEEHLEQRKVRLREAYAGLDSAELLQRIERPGLLQRLLRRDLPRPAGADPRCLTDLETRIGRQLPAAYRAALTRHDGFPELFMLPCATVAQPGDGMSMTSAPSIARRFAVVDEPARATLEVSSATLRQCWTIAGVADVPATPHDSQRGEVSATSNVYPFWLWCPDLHGQFIDLHQNRAHARFDSLLLEAVTAYNAARE